MSYFQDMQIVDERLQVLEATTDALEKKISKVLELLISLSSTLLDKDLESRLKKIH